MNKYFPFNELKDQMYDFEYTILLAILLFLVYIWYKLFSYWDR